MKRGTATLQRPIVFEEAYGSTKPITVTLLSYDAGGPSGPRWWCMFPTENYGWVDNARLTEVIVEVDFN